MIALDDYMRGRQQTHRRELTAEVKRNAPVMVRKANLLLNAFYADNPGAVTRIVTSGWRPPSVNAKTPDAATRSLHMTAQAIDLSDDDEELDDWLMSPLGVAAMESIGLWHELPAYTARYAHVQTKPPASGRRHFVPR